jgi:hypothetical protein
VWGKGRDVFSVSLIYTIYFNEIMHACMHAYNTYRFRFEVDLHSLEPAHLQVSGLVKVKQRLLRPTLLVGLDACSNELVRRRKFSGQALRRRTCSSITGLLLLLLLLVVVVVSNVLHCASSESGSNK